jgi:hypothetical protein
MKDNYYIKKDKKEMEKAKAMKADLETQALNKKLAKKEHSRSQSVEPSVFYGSTHGAKVQPLSPTTPKLGALDSESLAPQSHANTARNGLPVTARISNMEEEWCDVADPPQSMKNKDTNRKLILSSQDDDLLEDNAVAPKEYSSRRSKEMKPERVDIHEVVENKVSL